MPPKAKPRSRSGRSKSTEKKVPRSRSTSRARVATKAKKFSSETKRPRSKTPPSRESSPQKVSSRSVSSVTKTTTTISKSTASTSLVKNTSSCCWKSIPCKVACFVKTYAHPVMGLCFAPLMLFWFNCLVYSSKFSGTSIPIGRAQVPNTPMVYLNWPVWLVTALQFVKCAIITKYLKAGKRFSIVAGSRKIDYCNNFWLVLALFLLPYAVFQYKGDLIYKGFKPCAYMLANLPSQFACLFVFALFLSIHAYRKAGRATRLGSKSHSSLLLDVYFGREARPLMCGMDAKMLLYRFAVCLYAQMMLCIAWTKYEETRSLTPGLALAVIAGCIRVLDNMFCEHTSLSSYTIQSSGYGFNFMTLMLLMPVLAWSYTASWYLKYDNLVCEPICMGISALIFFIGFCLDRASRNQKYFFRADPHHPRFSGMESIPTSTGKKLLASGWWGIVRHPNYLGSMLMSLGLILPAGCNSANAWMLWVMYGFMALKTADRIKEVEENMSLKYGAAYAKYKSLVPKRIIPRVL